MPGVSLKKDWENWSKERDRFKINEDSLAPFTGFIPAMQKRRLSSLSRMALSTAYDCTKNEPMDRLTTVFSTHHGEFQPTYSLLLKAVHHEPFSASQFSHSVHNTAAGQFSILFNNRLPSTTLCAGDKGFSYSLIETLGYLKRFPGKNVLLTHFDEPLPPQFVKLEQPPSFAYSVSLLFGLGSRGEKLDLIFENGTERKDSAGNLPEALEFISWLTENKKHLHLGRDRFSLKVINKSQQK